MREDPEKGDLTTLIGTAPVARGMLASGTAALHDVGVAGIGVRGAGVRGMGVAGAGVTGMGVAGMGVRGAGVTGDKVRAGTGRLEGEMRTRIGSIVTTWYQVPFGVGIGGKRVGRTGKRP
jgi:hypothetical protein